MTNASYQAHIISISLQASIGGASVSYKHSTVSLLDDMAAPSRRTSKIWVEAQVEEASLVDRVAK